MFETKPVKIAVLFDGAGLARLGLEQAGHECIGYEINPIRVYLSSFMGSGNCEIADALEVDLRGFDAVWASPPCQDLSHANTLKDSNTNYLKWCLSLDVPILWIENVHSNDDSWGVSWNAAQFLKEPLQSRPRVVGGRYIHPVIYHSYSRHFPNLLPTVVASEWKSNGFDYRRASRAMGRRLTVEECATAQGFVIPQDWYNVPPLFTKRQWDIELYEAIGDGVPVYMARAFGEVYT